MNGNYLNTPLNPFSVPPPNYLPRSTNWGSQGRRTQASHFSGIHSHDLEDNNGSSSLHAKGKGHTFAISKDEASPISVPPPVAPYLEHPKLTNIYNPAHHIYSSSSRLPGTGIQYQGAVTYVPIPAETYAAHAHAYYPQPPPPPPMQHATPPPPPPPSGHYHTSNPQRNFYYKRKSTTHNDFLQKGNKKKKKSLSQNIPQRKDWSVEDAKRAINVEREYNKRNRSASLIIKFPDKELNRDIVATFHPSIESVHFQQPSTPRFCFVTLKDNVNAEEVMEKLNKTRFGQGFLSVEYKKDREDDLNIGPEDIDPLTLYVGNLAQDIMKEDMVKIYPKHKRVDIGYAKKMKYTRYAFVSFKNVDDSIEAFKKTHSTQLYSKSLIVRFRRLHGTVGMPGEPKPQLPQRTNDNRSQEMGDYPHDETSNGHLESTSPWGSVDVSQWHNDISLKQECTDEGSDEECDDMEELFDQQFSDMRRDIFEHIDRKSLDQMKVGLKSGFPNACNSDKSTKIPPATKKDVDSKLAGKESSDNLPNAMPSELETSLLQSDDETEAKPTWLVEAKSPHSKLLPRSTNSSSSSSVIGISANSVNLAEVHKPLLEPKKEVLIVEEEKIETEKPKLIDEASFFNIQIKTESVTETADVQEEGDTCNAFVSEATPPPDVTIDIKKERLDDNQTQSSANLELPLVVVKNEPIDEDDKEEEENENLSDEEEFSFENLLSNLDDTSKKLKKLRNMVL